IARGILDGDDRVGRVIARPFLGDNAEDFKRTENRHDYAVPPPRDNLLPLLKDAGLDVVCIGKIASIYDSMGVTEDLTAKNNDQTKPGSDHTREYVPLLVYGKNARPGVDLGTRQSLSDIGQTIAENFGIRIVDGTSFLDNVG